MIHKIYTAKLAVVAVVSLYCFATSLVALYQSEFKDQPAGQNIDLIQYTSNSNYSSNNSSEIATSLIDSTSKTDSQQDIQPSSSSSSFPSIPVLTPSASPFPRPSLAPPLQPPFVGYATSKQAPSPSHTPTPYKIFISENIHGTRERSQETYWDTTVNTPLEIPFKELVNINFKGSDIILEPPQSGKVKLDGSNIVYTPLEWHIGTDKLSYTVQKTQNGKIKTWQGTVNIRIRVGLVLNRPLLNLDSSYHLSEVSFEMQPVIRNLIQYFFKSNLTVFPEHDTWLHRRYNTCAIVGNGGSLIGRKRGAEIDSHDVVVRINKSPLIGYEEDIGTKMNITFSGGPTSSTCWKRDLREVQGRSYEIVAQATFYQDWDGFASCGVMEREKEREEEEDARITPMNYLFVDLVDSILNAYQRVKFNGTDKKYRSTGMLAVTAMAMICDHVSVYGFERGPNMENTYYPNVNDREWSGHSYLAEKEYFKDLAKGTGLFEQFLKLYDLYKSFSYIVD